MKSYQFETPGGGPEERRPSRRARGPAQARRTEGNTANEEQRGETGVCARGPALRGWSQAVALWMGVAIMATAQTRIDLRTQSKSVDFSEASSTKPSKTGTTLPATCSVGETFLKTTAPAGKNLYVCTLANTWTVQGADVPDTAGNADKVLSNDGSTPAWRAFGGDANGRPDALTVTALRNRTVALTTPASGQALMWNSASGQWEPQTPIGAVSSIFGRAGAVGAQAGDYTFGQISGAIADSQVGAGINANKIGAGTVSNMAFAYLASVTSDLQAQLNAKAVAAHSHSAAGDVSGDLGSTTVMALWNRAVAATAPANGQALAWNSAAAQWQPQNLSGAVSSIFGRAGVVTAQTGDYTFGQISGAVTDSQVSAGINANKTGAGTVSNTAFGYLANVSSDIQTQLNAKAAATHSHTAAGDASGDIGSLTVTALRNRAVAATAPSGGQVLTWDGANSQWTPQTLPSGSGGGSTGAYSSSFSSQTTVTILGTAHQLGTANVLVGCYDASTPAMRVQPDTVSVHPTTYDVTITFATAQSGRCVVSTGGGGSGGSGGGGASMGSQLGDWNVTRTSASVLTIGANCSAATPCNVRLGSRVYTFVNSATATLTSGTGTVYIYVDANGGLVAGHNLTLACTSPCTAAAGVAAFPVNSIPLYTWSATGGAWDAGGGLDKRALLSGKIVSAGTGIATLDTGSNTTVSVDSALVPMYLTASSALDFGPIATGTCAADLTLSLPGAAVGDAVAPGWPAALEAGLIGNMRVSAANTIAVRLCNFSGGTVDPAGATYRSTIVRSF